MRAGSRSRTLATMPLETGHRLGVYEVFVMIKDPDHQPPLEFVAVPYFLEEMQERLRQARK